MAKVGELLREPEVGWERYDDTDKNISYLGLWKNSSALDEYYLKTYHYTDDEDGSINFNFKGSKIRIISAYFSNQSDNIIIIIDGEKYKYSCYDSELKRQILVFEKNDLTYGEHSVIIQNMATNKNGIILDSIDIDENGQLKQYNPYRFIIKQHLNYYSVKSNFYYDGSFQPLVLNGEIAPNDSDFINSGFTDLALLTENINMREEIFKPKDKLKLINDGKFDILMKEI